MNRQLNRQSRLDIEETDETIDISKSAQDVEKVSLENIIIKSSDIVEATVPTISVCRNSILGTRYEMVDPDTKALRFVKQDCGTSWTKIGIERNEIALTKQKMLKMYTSCTEDITHGDILLHLFSSPVLIKTIIVKMKDDNHVLVDVHLFYFLKLEKLIRGAQGIGITWEDIGINIKQGNRIRCIINGECNRFNIEGERRRRQRSFDFIS